MSGELLPLGVDLDGGAVHRLIHGGFVRVPHHALGPAGSRAHTLFVTHSQMKGARAAKHRGKHMRLHMTADQVAYNVKHGSGIFGNIWNGIKNFVGNNQGAIKKGAAALAGLAVPKALDAVQNYASKKLPQYASQIATARGAAQNAINGQLGGKVRRSRKHSKAGAAKYIFGNTNEIEHNLGVQTGGGSKKPRRSRKVHSYAGDSSELTHNLGLTNGDPISAAAYAVNQPIARLRK